ncbi:transcriptional regulator, AraC family [Pedobacter westerhofensis]|uniref:Transcriptional regulator, AraC family n=1 Tax=Pedobacter westerhofensis TaxID=425512 RepID=A0A521BA47_9SPHI|nr:AraC family transcriptional regulator [Pedobacter westerhofensis]SMO43974.1 transcriptional regulator, AraC family [Pedobacter westerhofensis]
MVNYFKYLPLSKEDESWGASVLNAGCTSIKATAAYPLKTHPAHHNFDWKTWRSLQEYQIIYITDGQGVFESESCKETVVRAGTIIILFPNEKHRYKPDNNTGWDEYWVGLKGPAIDSLLKFGYLRLDKPCIYVGFDDRIFDILTHIIENTKEEKPGYQPLISGAVMHLLGICHAITKQHSTGTKEEEQIINKSKLLFRSNISNAYSAEQAAIDLNVGYSWFRKLFKDYSGMSPGQYYLQLKIDKARDLLGNSNMPVKVISMELNFQSSFYFSKLFKDKTGLKPTEYRRRSHILSRVAGPES